MSLLGDIGKSVLKGAAWYLEETSKSNSRSKNYSDEQREGFREFSDTMHNFRESLNGNSMDDEDDY